VEWLGNGELRARLHSGGGGYGAAEHCFTLGREVVLVARGGGGDGIVTMAEMNRPTRANTGVWPPNGNRGLWPIGHDARA